MMMKGSEREIILDLSRLISRVLHATPTGVDRCEMAYARGLLDAVPTRLQFAAVHPMGFYGRLPKSAALRFLDATEERWTHRGAGSIWDMRRFAAGALAALRPRFNKSSHTEDRRIFIQASPNNLTRPELISRILASERARMICLVHDLIPVEFPEYAREGGAAKHARRIRTIVDHADGIIANSASTLASLQPWIERSGRAPSARVAHLGTHVNAAHHSGVVGDRPYFVCVGTIEPRKNHLLLLNLWRRMAEERGAEETPTLVIIGRRGWENEQVVDMLERSPALKGCVEERGRVTDNEAAKLIAGSCGLLMPSFAEGYGMPITEAMSLGVPVICSDLAALREAGSDVPCYLDPLDGPAWQKAIEDLALPSSRLRTKQAACRVGWRAPTWREHIAIVLDLVHELGT